MADKKASKAKDSMPKINTEGIPNTIKNGDRVAVFFDPLTRKQQEGVVTVINVLDQEGGQVTVKKVRYIQRYCKVRFDEGLVTHRWILCKK